MIEGILFDMDGILFDTERIAQEIDADILREMGFETSAVFQQKIAGLNWQRVRSLMEETLGERFDFEAFRDTARLRMAQTLQQLGGPPLLPGVKDALDWLKAQGYPMAVASSTRIATVNSHLEAAGIASYFSTVIGGDMVEKSKPEPDIFLKAASAIGIPPGQCVALEDSYAGVRSAAAAGCVTVMVPNTMPPTDETRRLTAAILDDMGQLPRFIRLYQDSLNTLPGRDVPPLLG